MPDPHRDPDSPDAPHVDAEDSGYVHPPNSSAARQPIQTYVEEFNPEVIARAIRGELERGGQVFYLHNRIESLPEVEQFIRSIVPEALTESAHGQMDPAELEDIMHRFIHGAFHVLVSTTIIENGIDIPNVNTIIIDRADFYGVSQLYQLRGRVGRSDRQAFAFLLYPDKRALSEIAMKRLQIISDFTELGSGFKIAMKDLEVRGAGNLLGREQSGDIFAVGFDMYLKLLDDAVNALSGAPQEEEEPYLELEYSGYIPDTYIAMPMIKMEIYKKIASIYRQDELDGLQEELESRFGPMPEELQSLLSLAEIRILCRKLSVSSLKERAGTVSVEFSKVSKISVERLLRLMRESNGRLKLDPKKPNAIILQTKAIGLREKSEFIRSGSLRLPSAYPGFQTCFLTKEENRRSFSQPWQRASPPERAACSTLFLKTAEPDRDAQPMSSGRKAAQSASKASFLYGVSIKSLVMPSCLISLATLWIAARRAIFS